MPKIMSDISNLQDRVEIAKKAIQKAGEYLVEEYQKRTYLDSNADTTKNISIGADKISEKIITQFIINTFPEDSIISEESRMQKKSNDYTWIIDPLDGTSNFSMGISYFGICISIYLKKTIQYAVIYNPLLNEITEGSKEMGVYHGDKKMVMSNECNKLKYVGFYIQGYGISDDEHLSNYSNLVGISKRICTTWAPSLDWVLLLRGGADYIVTYETEREDFLAGAFLYSLAGGKIITWSGKEFNFELNQVENRVTTIAANPTVIMEIQSKLKLMQERD